MPANNEVNNLKSPQKSPETVTPQDFKPVKNIMYALVVVLFVGFAGMFIAVAQMMIDSLNDKRDSTYELQVKIDTLNDKIDKLEAQKLQY